MTAFLRKVEASLLEVEVSALTIKPVKPKKALPHDKPYKGKPGEKSMPAVKPKPANPQDVKAKKKKKKKDPYAIGRPATAEKKNFTQTNFARLKKYMPKFMKDVQVADPFDVADPTWGKFFYEAAPDILVTILWDLGVVTEPKERALLSHYFRQRVKAG